MQNYIDFFMFLGENEKILVKEQIIGGIGMSRKTLLNTHEMSNAINAQKALF